MTTYWVYKDAQGFWRWYLEAGNGRKIANSGEGFYNEADCLHSIGLVMDTNRSTPVRKR